jgi:rhomboid protease GluP
MFNSKTKHYIRKAKIDLKIREIFLPFLLVSIGTILGWNLFLWIFDIQLNVLPINQELLHIFIPLSIPWIPVLIWLRRRLRILDIRGKRDNRHFLYQFLMLIAISVPLMMSQNYLLKTAYDLKEIDSVSEIKNLKNEKYIKIQNFQVNQQESARQVTSSVSGKYNEYINFYFYIASPFADVDNVWYGVKYTRKTSNRANEEKINMAYRRFQKSSFKQFKSYNFKDVNYFEILDYSRDKNGFIEAIKEKIPLVNEKEHIILIPKKNNFDERLSINIPWIFGSFLISSFVIFLMIIIPKIDKGELIRYQKKKPIRDDDLYDILEFLNPKGEYKTSALLILGNIIVFIVMIFSGIDIFSPSARELLNFGGNLSTEVHNGAYWRLFTSLFIHAGLLHLISNIMGIGIACVQVEKILGSFRLLMVYLICGILAALISMYWNENTVGVGASGAIFGIFGLQLSFVIFKIFPKYIHNFILSMLGIFGGISLLFGFISKGIDNAAHIGGLVIGFIIGIILISLNKEELKRKANHFT